jgi:hypothetical protein
MQTPLEINFKSLAGTPSVEDSIARHVAELEQRYGRATAYRVAVKGPGSHHHTAGSMRCMFVSRSPTAGRSMSLR